MLELLTILAAHVDDERERIADPDRTRDPVTGGAVSVTDLHVALRRTQRKHHWIARLSSVGGNTAGLPVRFCGSREGTPLGYPSGFVEHRRVTRLNYMEASFIVKNITSRILHNTHCTLI